MYSRKFGTLVRIHVIMLLLANLSRSTCLRNLCDRFLLDFSLRSQIAENIEGFKKRLEALRGVKNMLLGSERVGGAYGGSVFCS